MKRLPLTGTVPPGNGKSLPGSISDRAAIVLLALFILFVISVPKYDLAGVLAFASFPLLFLTGSGIALSPLMKRLLLATPFILFMGAGNIVLDRAPDFTIGGLTLTRGMVSATVMATKTVATLSALLGLLACMPFHRFGRALRSLGVPEVFVTQLLLVYRYSFLLSEEAAMMQKARDLRSFNGKGRGPLVTARLIGALLVRTTSRAERIYRAMDARGFTTALAESEPAKVTARDLGAILAGTTLFLIFRLLF